MKWLPAPQIIKNYKTLSEEKETAEAALEAKMERWMELSELAETIAQNKQSLPKRV